MLLNIACSIPLDGSSAAQCLTCDIVNCSYVSASFSSTGRYYVLGCRGPGIPQYWLKDTQSEYGKTITLSIRRLGDNHVNSRTDVSNILVIKSTLACCLFAELLLEDNADVAANLAERDMPRVEYHTPPIGGGYCKS